MVCLSGRLTLDFVRSQRHVHTFLLISNYLGECVQTAFLLMGAGRVADFEPGLWDSWHSSDKYLRKLFDDLCN